jgi:hypothetical protein
MTCVFVLPTFCWDEQATINNERTRVAKEVKRITVWVDDSRKGIAGERDFRGSVTGFDNKMTVSYLLVKSSALQGPNIVFRKVV